MKKKFWKYLNIIVAAECVILIIIIFTGVMAYRLELGKEQAEYETFMRNIMDWEYDISGNESDVYDIFYRLNSNRASKEYGVVMRLMDQYGAKVCETTTMNQILSWDPGASGEKSLVQLDRYFSEENMDKLVAFYYDYEEQRLDHEEQGQMEMQKMQGYYNAYEEFTPIEVVFGDVDGQKILYTLTNETAKRQLRREHLFWRFNTNISGQGYEGRVDGRGNEYGSSWISFNKTQRIFNEKARAKLNSRTYSLRNQFLPGVYTYDVKCRFADGNRKIQAYRVSFYADIDYITIHSHEFHKDVLMIVVFCQVVGTVIMVGVFFMNKRRQRLQQMRNTFINAIAHEMKTPVAVVKNGAECIREEIHPEKRTRYVEMIDREADHMSDLLNAMLVYTRVSDAGYDLKKEPVSLAEICQEVWEHYQPVIEEKEIVFEMEGENSFCLKGDPALLEMVVDNLFSNALRYCPQGETIRLSISQTSLFMFNNGRHIPDTETDRIWEPFYQVSAARSSQSSSAGMGLAISAQILKLHHLKYGVRNVRGGVEFYISA